LWAEAAGMEGGCGIMGPACGGRTVRLSRGAVVWAHHAAATRLSLAGAEQRLRPGAGCLGLLAPRPAPGDRRDARLDRLVPGQEQGPQATPAARLAEADP